MAVISAGVIMNIIFAALLFVVVAMAGKNFLAPVVGDVRKHYPADRAKITWHSGPAPTTQPVVTTGLKSGDRIVRIDGDSSLLAVLGNDVTCFERLLPLSTLADEDDVFVMNVEREVDGNTWAGTAEVAVRMGPGEMGGRRLSFGIYPALDTVVRERRGISAHQSIGPLEAGDRITAINGRPVVGYWDIEAILKGDLPGSHATITVRRGEKNVDLKVPLQLEVERWTVYAKDSRRLDIRDYEVSQEKKEVELTSLIDGSKEVCKLDDLTHAYADEILDLLGMVPRLQVTAIVGGSSAEEAGLKPGDIIVSYGDRSTPTIKQFIEINREVADKGTHIAVQRGGKMLEPVQVIPKKKDELPEPVIGILRHVDLQHTVVAGVRSGSPAAEAGIEPGAVIEKVNDRPVKSWLDVYRQLKASQGREVTLTYRRSSWPNAPQQTAAIGKLDRAIFDPSDYRYTFPGATAMRQLQVTLRKDNVVDALGWGLRETGSFILTTYATLRGLVRGTVSGQNIFGPVGMGYAAIQVGRRSFIDLIYFMALISATVGVLNFLPFPVLDGGHAVFLIIEKIRRKPVPVKVMNIAQVIGLAVILLVFLAVTWQDLKRFFS